MKDLSTKIPLAISLSVHGILIGGLGLAIGHGSGAAPNGLEVYAVSIESSMLQEGAEVDNAHLQDENSTTEEIIPIRLSNKVSEVQPSDPQKIKPEVHPVKQSHQKLDSTSHHTPLVLPAIGVPNQQNGSGVNNSTSGLGLGIPISTATLRYAPKPIYPAIARKVGAEGSVVLNAQIDEGGFVKKVALVSSSGREDLDSAAQSTVAEKWKFSPALRGGVPIPSEENIVIVFKLTDVG